MTTVPMITVPVTACRALASVFSSYCVAPLQCQEPDSEAEAMQKRQHHLEEFNDDGRRR